MSSAFCCHFDQSKILSSGNGLTTKFFFSRVSFARQDCLVPGYVIIDGISGYGTDQPSFDGNSPYLGWSSAEPYQRKLQSNHCCIWSNPGLQIKDSNYDIILTY